MCIEPSCPLFKVHSHLITHLFDRLARFIQFITLSTWAWQQKTTGSLSVMETIFQFLAWAHTRTLEWWEGYNLCTFAFSWPEGSSVKICDWLNISMWMSAKKKEKLCYPNWNTTHISKYDHFLPSDAQRHCTWMCQACHRCGLQAFWWCVGLF